MFKFIRSKEQKFHDAVKDGNTSKVEKYLNGGAADLGYRDKIGENALEKACKSGHTKIVKMLLDSGADLHEKGARQMTVLHVASVFGHEQIVEVLIDNGANIHDKDKLGETPLHKASKMGYNKIVELLLEKGANIDDKDLQGQTALHTASLKGHEEAVNILLDNSANIQEKTSTNRTSLQIASEEGHKGIVKILQLKDQDNVENKGKNSMIEFVAQTFQKNKRKVDVDQQPQAEQTEEQLSLKVRIDNVATKTGHSFSSDVLGLKGKLSELGEVIDGSKEIEDGALKRLKDLEDKAEKLKFGIPNLSHKISGSSPRVLWNKLISSVNSYSVWELGNSPTQEHEAEESLKEHLDQLEISFYGKEKDGSLMERFEALKGQL